MSENVICSSLFICILAGSAKPNNEWSVKQTRYPMVRAYRMHSWASEEELWWPWMMCTFSRSRMLRNRGMNEKRVGNTI